jgi:hypothetical protein
LEEGEREEVAATVLLYDKVSVMFMLNVLVLLMKLND